MPGWVKDGNVQGVCVHTAGAVTENSESSAPVAPSFPANEKPPVFNFVNCMSTAMTMETMKSEQYTNSYHGNSTLRCTVACHKYVCGVFGKRGIEILACMKIVHNLR